MWKVYFLVIFTILLLQQYPAYSQSGESNPGESTTEDSAGSDTNSGFGDLFNMLTGDLLDKAVGGSIKKYAAPKIKSVKFVERGADFLVVDITYSRALAPGLELRGHATHKGRKINGITSLPTPLTNPSGKVQIRIARSKDGAPEITSDGVFITITMTQGDGKPNILLGHPVALAKIWSQLEWLDELGPGELIFAGGPPTVDIIQKISGSKSIPRLKGVVRQTKPTLHSTRLKRTYSHKAVSTFKYTATTRNRVKKEGRVHAGNLVWNCRSKSCTISGPWPTPGLSACNRLARIVGQITSYGHPKKRLSASQLTQCNRGAAK